MSQELSCRPDKRTTLLDPKKASEKLDAETLKTAKEVLGGKMTATLSDSESFRNVGITVMDGKIRVFENTPQKDGIKNNTWEYSAESGKYLSSSSFTFNATNDIFPPNLDPHKAGGKAVLDELRNAKKSCP